jgi:type IV pilus assembly protein PilA
MPASSAIAPEALGFLAEMPASTVAFGVLDLHESLQTTIDSIVARSPWLGPLVADLKDMAQRRLGLDFLPSRSIGLAGFDVSLADRPDKIEVVGVFQATSTPTGSFVPMPDLSGGFINDDIALYKLGSGSYWAIGEKNAITALAAARAKDATRYVAAHADFIRWAWAKAGSEFLFAMQAPASAQGKPGVGGALGQFAVTLDRRDSQMTLRASLQARAGKEKELQAGIAEARAEVRKQAADAIAQLQQTSAPMARIATLYWTTIDSNVKVAVTSAEATMEFGIKMPIMPAMLPAPSLQQRMAVANENSVLQFNLGAPLLDTLIASTDVFTTPIDRAAIRTEVIALVPPGVPIDMSSIVVSMGDGVGRGLEGFLISVMSGKPVSEPLQLGSLSSRVTPWGLVVGAESALTSSSAAPAAIDARLQQPSATAVFRAAVDVARLPAALQATVSKWARSWYIEIASDRFLIEVQATKDQGQAILGFWNMLKPQAMSEIKPKYDNRKTTTDPEQEIQAVFAYHFATLIFDGLEPTLVGDDLMRIELKMPTSQSAPVARGVVVAWTVGMLAAVAVPAFMDYMKKGKQSEAQLRLNILMKNQKVAFNMDGKYPTVTAPLTPAVSCCQSNAGGKGQCAGGDPQWQGKQWMALDFTIEDPHRFRYSMESTADRFVAKAVGDLDCDGKEITYTLTGSVKDGKPLFQLDSPSPDAD